MNFYFKNHLLSNALLGSLNLDYLFFPGALRELISSVTWHWNLGLTYLLSTFNLRMNGEGYAQNFGLRYRASAGPKA